MTIILTGGGTAGHVLPNMALVPHLRKFFDRIFYIGGTSPHERDMVESEGIKFYPLQCVKFHRGFGPRQIWKNLGLPAGYLKSTAEAGKLLDELHPDLVFSKGGFVALPVVRAAKRRGIPVVLHESDATMGLANRLSLGAASAVCTTFPSKYNNTGAPIRQKIYSGDKDIVTRRHALAPCNRNLLVVGGSLGAAKINETVRQAIPELTKTYNIIHICGRGKAQSDNANAHYIPLEYADDIENYLALADIVVSRAGSNALCELMALGKPTLFIPLSTGRGDQIANVAEIKKFDCAGVLHEQDLNAKSLVGALENVWLDRVKYSSNAKMAINDGTDAIVKIIKNAIKFDKSFYPTT